MRERDIDAWDSFQRQMWQTRREPVQPAECAVVAAARGDDRDFDRWLQAVEEKPVMRTSPVSSAARLALSFHDFSRAERLIRAALLPQYSTKAHVDAHLLLAELEIARGRWRAAQPHLDAAAQFDPTGVRLFRSILATLPFLELSPEELEATRRNLQEWSASAIDAGGISRLVAASLPHLRLYLMALLSARLGEVANALSLADRVDALEVPAGAGAIRRDLARTVRADVAWRQGRPEDVVDTLAHVRGEIPLELIFRAGRDRQPEYSYAFSQGHARWLRARSLHLLGRSDEALRWLDTFVLVPDELLYAGPVHQAKAEAYDRLGHHGQSREHYARFAALWENADHRDGNDVRH